MTPSSFLPSIHIHPILLIFIAISFVTGTFFQLLIVLTIVLFHELGHYLMAKHFKWRIQHIMLWVFGGVMDTDEHGNRPIHEELLVTIAGPFQHVNIYVFLYVCTIFQLLPESILELILFYNTVVLLFNLLPIWPLDGGKVLFLCLSLFLPYQKAYHMIIIFSMLASICILILQLFLFPFTLSAFFIMIFLFMENRSEWRQRYYVFMRFLLKRYYGNAPVKGVRPLVVSYKDSLMDVFALFQRDKKHPIYVSYPNNERKSIDENDCLRSYFHDKEYNKTIGEVGSYLM